MQFSKSISTLQIKIYSPLFVVDNRRQYIDSSTADSKDKLWNSKHHARRHGDKTQIGCKYLGSCLITPSLPPFILPCTPQLPSSPCWLGPSVAPTWIVARPRSSCHCCAVGAARPPAWWGAARPEILPGPLPCTLPGPLTGWAGGACGFRRAPET